jgi:hypothetical protein
MLPSNPELRIDLAEVTKPDRLRLLKLSGKVGGTVLNENIRTLLAGAPEPHIPSGRDLEKQLAQRDPFSFVVRPNKAGRFAPGGKFDPDFRHRIIEQVRPFGVTDLAVTAGLQALCLFGSRYFAERARCMREALQVDCNRSDDGDYQLTFNAPGEVTAQHLHWYNTSLGKIGTYATLAILAQVSQPTTYPDVVPNN